MTNQIEKANYVGNIRSNSILSKLKYAALRDKIVSWKRGSSNDAIWFDNKIGVFADVYNCKTGDAFEIRVDDV